MVSSFRRKSFRAGQAAMKAVLIVLIVVGLAVLGVLIYRDTHKPGWGPGEAASKEAGPVPLEGGGASSPQTPRRGPHAPGGKGG